MKKIFQNIKSGIIIGVSCLVTVTIGVFAYNLTYTKVLYVESGQSLTAETFNQMIANIEDLNNRVSLLDVSSGAKIMFPDYGKATGTNYCNKTQMNASSTQISGSPAKYYEWDVTEYGYVHAGVTFYPGTTLPNSPAVQVYVNNVAVFNSGINNAPSALGFIGTFPVSPTDRVKVVAADSYGGLGNIYDCYIHFIPYKLVDL